MRYQACTPEVEVYENYIDVISSVHKECEEKKNWEEVKASNPPKEPKQTFNHEQEAKKKLNDYTPSFFDKLFKKGEKKEKKLQGSLEKEKEIDSNEYKEKFEEFEKQHGYWKTSNEIAAQICEGNIEAYSDAIKFENPFSEFQDYGSEIQFQIKDKDFVVANIKVREKDVIPTEAKSLLKSGRLSVKSMPKTKFYELYQDFVCGVVLRVARELFALLPIEKTLVNATCNMLNTKTGHMEDMPILSVLFPRQTLDGFNFESIDPSDSLENFVHVMKFKKSGGFNPIDALKSESFQKEE